MPNSTKVNGKPSSTPTSSSAGSAFPLDISSQTLILLGNNSLHQKRVEINKYKPNIKETDVMKTFLTILSILSIGLFASCGGGGDDTGGDANGSAADGNASE